MLIGMSWVRAPIGLVVTLCSFAACRSVIGLTAPEAAPDGAAYDSSSDAPSSTRDAPDASPDSAGGVTTPYWTFTDDFESGGFGRWQQIIDPGMAGNLTVVDAGAYRGCCAMQASVPAGASSSYEYLVMNWKDAGTPADFVRAGTIALRAHTKITAIDQIVGLLAVVQGGSQSSASAAGLVDPNGSGASWGQQLVDPGNPGPGGKGQNASTLLPEGGADGQWHCVELDMTVGDASAGGALSLFVDPAGPQAAPVATFDADTLATLGWDSVTLGVLYSSPGTVASTVAYDDAEIDLYTDTSPAIHIGCP